jgi:hypothetical protein
VTSTSHQRSREVALESAAWGPIDQGVSKFALDARDGRGDGQPNGGPDLALPCDPDRARCGGLRLLRHCVSGHDPSHRRLAAHLTEKGVDHDGVHRRLSGRPLQAPRAVRAPGALAPSDPVVTSWSRTPRHGTASSITARISNRAIPGMPALLGSHGHQRIPLEAEFKSPPPDSDGFCEGSATHGDGEPSQKSCRQGRQAPATCRVAALRRFHTLMLAMARTSPASCLSSKCSTAPSQT